MNGMNGTNGNLVSTDDFGCDVGMDRPHCRQTDACKAKAPGKHCSRCQASSPETRARRSASAKAYLEANPQERERRSAQAKAHSSNPATLAKRTETLTVIGRTPEMREVRRRARLRMIEERKDDPAFIEAMRESGRRIGRHNLVHTMTPEVRARAAVKIRAALLPWCPPEHWDWNKTMKRAGLGLAERQRIIGEEVARNDPAAVARRAIAEFDKKQRERHARERAQAY